MVLAQEAEILLLDEPTAALDLRHQWEVLDAARARLHRERGVDARRRRSTISSRRRRSRTASRCCTAAASTTSARPSAASRAETLRDVFGVDARVAKEDGFLRVRVRGPADPLRSL